MHRSLLGTIWLLAAVMLLAACSDTPSRQESAAEAVAQMSALEQMAIAFDGDYARFQIESRLSRAMELYGLDLTEDNYSRAGSTLVALRREFGISEMDILDYMICSHVEGVNVSFPDMAGLAVGFIEAGDSCQ